MKFELTFFNELANSCHASLLNRSHWDHAADGATKAAEDSQDFDWMAILGLSESSIFKSLAETETKKINAAYRQALPISGFIALQRCRQHVAPAVGVPADSSNEVQEPLVISA